MKKDNIIRDKSFNFAIRVVRACIYLMKEKKEFVLSKQLLKSGTSIVANVEEAQGGYSDPDFAYKINIAYKESRETRYWIRLLHATGYFKTTEAKSLLKDAIDISRILSSILITSNAKKNHKK